jgi:hypothetical protein
MNAQQIASRIATADRYVARHGRCCGCYSNQYGCATHGQAPAAGPLSDANGKFVWFLLGRTVGQQARRVKHYL